MRIIQQIVVVLALVLLLSCNTTATVKEYIRTSEITWLETSDMDIVNENGDPILLKGLVVNSDVWGDWVDGVSQELMDNGKDPLFRPQHFDSWSLQDRDFEILHDLGINVVRYSIAYEQFMPENPLREQNLAKLISDTQKFNDLGIYVIPALQAPPGLDVQNEYYEDNYHGDQRIQNFIESDEHFMSIVTMWEYLATAFKDNPGIAGYELTNEPRMPCDAQGGEELFRSRLSELCRSIREIDDRHILFVPEYNSREANPGERYWSQSLEAETVDQGEQGVIWEQNFVQMDSDISNIVYVFHFYTPYEFTHDGSSHLDRQRMDRALKERIEWAQNTLHAPLICSEFGVNWQQPAERRAEWAEYMLRQLDSNGISATYYHYKAVLDPFNYPFHLYGIYAEYVDMDSQMNIYTNPDSYEYRYSWLEMGANESGFDETFETWLWSQRREDGEVPTFTQLDNAPLIDVLKEYFNR